MPHQPTSRRLRAALLAAALLVPAGARAQQTQPPALDAATRRDVVDTIAQQLRRHYVDADTGRLIADVLTRRLRAGAYDAATTPAVFGELLTTDLRSVNGDKHLVVVFAPGDPGDRPGPDGIRLLRGPRPDDDRVPAAEQEAERARHYGLGRVDVLPGNVGYLEVRGFSEAPQAREQLVAALRYLESTDAVVIDLRRNGGGSGVLSNLLISHFTGPDTLASLVVRNRSGHEQFTRYTLASVPGPRRPKVPLYVLTSRRSASAAEDVAFVLQHLGRATIIGEPSAGAGHNNAFLDAGHGFNVSISFSRVSDPRTGEEWERVGVKPDVAVEQDRALETAHARALGELAARTEVPPRRRVLELMSETVRAQAERRPTDPAALAFAGEYAGGRTIAARDGQLHIAPLPGLPDEPLVPIDATHFAIGATRIAFERDAQGAAQLRVTQPDGGSRVYARVR